MSSSNQANPVGVVPVTAGVMVSGMALALTFLCGGFGVGVASVFLLGPVLTWLIWGQAALPSAIGSALIGAAGLACFQMLGAVPQAVPGLTDRLLQFLPWTFGVLGGAALVKLRFAGKETKRTETPARPYTDHETELMLPEDGPILILDISSFERIRARFGSEKLFPAAQPGQIAADVVVDSAGATVRSGGFELAGARPGACLNLAHRHGRYIVLVDLSSLGLVSQNELDAELRTRTAFFASLGHDLKSPLNAILGFAEMMDMEVRGPMPKAYKEYPGLIRDGGQTLDRLIADFLDYAKSETGAYEIDPAPLDVAATADAVIRQSQAAAAQAEVSLRLAADGEILAMADAGAVRRIWDNLVSNAIKYSRGGQRIDLAATTKGDWVELSVSDQGVGMSEADLAVIAAPFAQGSNAKGRAGTGLGLAMVDRLARLHGGRVKIETAPGEGTRVSVSLPAAAQVLRKAAE